MNVTRLSPIKPATASPITSSKRATVVDSSKIRVEASALLAEILACLHGVELPIIQLMPASPTGLPDNISSEFAAASAAQFGRTLLLDARARIASNNGGQAIQSHSKKQRRPLAAVPDGAIPGLYHRLASDIPFEMVTTETPDAHPFRMVVVRSGSPEVCPSGLNHARQCNGTILTVAAGLTRLLELRTTARQIHNSGGTLLGVVLFDAPKLRLPFHIWSAK